MPRRLSLAIRPDREQCLGKRAHRVASMNRSAVILAAAAIAVVFSLRQDVGAATTHSQETYKALDAFGEVFERVRSQYVTPVDDEKLIEGAINGMLTSLDPHSNYLSEKDFGDMKVQTRGEFGGLGIEVSMENGLVKVVSPIDDTPAARAGLKPGDLITRLDGQPVLGMTLPQAVEKMRGPINSDIKLTIRRSGKNPFDVTLTRATIKIQSVRSDIVGGDIGYIRITNFSEQTDVGLGEALKRLKHQAGDKLRGLVLDLRNNPGGLLDQAVSVANAFL
jgi:carboxyl-terminal processing protease